jgi:hypothetical protein
MATSAVSSCAGPGVVTPLQTVGSGPHGTLIGGGPPSFLSGGVPQSPLFATGTMMIGGAPPEVLAALQAPAPAPASVSGGGAFTGSAHAGCTHACHQPATAASIAAPMAPVSSTTGGAIGTPPAAAATGSFQAVPRHASPSLGTSSARAGVLLIGDSLSVGTKRYFTESLTGQPVEVDATGGISLREGMRRYNARPNKPRVVQMALFTNNSPNDIEQLRAAIQQTITDARARGGRVVWATIVRPGDYSSVNRMIRDMAAANSDVMGLVDWERMVQQHPEWMSSDRVHATANGYRARATAFAEAARA